MDNQDYQHDPRFDAPLERTFDRLITPFEEFVHGQTSSGIVLLFVTILALVLANSPFASIYHHIVELPAGIHLGDWVFDRSVHHWVNEGLMALFFFHVGLEIKREMLVGELASPHHALLPIIAAIGGMLGPALIYHLFNLDGPGVHGWGIPMATDIAFVVGALVLLGNRIPRTLMMFLVALAIVDDLGAVLIIALFYTKALNVDALLTAALLYTLLILLNRGGVRNAWPYFLVGILVWFQMLGSGIHAAVAGVVIAFAIPARPRCDSIQFSSFMRRELDEFDAAARSGIDLLRNETQRHIFYKMQGGMRHVETPLRRLEHSLRMPVGILVMPIFALVNAGIELNWNSFIVVLTDGIGLGIIFGLLIGKFIGIAGSTWLAVRFGIAHLPGGADMRHIIGVGLLGGIGFTMSIFIAELAFAGQNEALLHAKTGVLFASLCAAILGMGWLYYISRDKDPGLTISPQSRTD